VWVATGTVTTHPHQQQASGNGTTDEPPIIDVTNYDDIMRAIDKLRTSSKTPGWSGAKEIRKWRDASKRS